MTSSSKAINMTLVKPGLYDLQGELTFATVNQIHKQANKILKLQTESTISLNNVNQIDSAGLALLIDWSNPKTHNQSIQFSNPNQQLLRLMDLYNLKTVLIFVEQK
ncbi:MAG: STAS domain-containing protein [Gammaproteobacteria bacterium]|nr:STAS domain-containing protein [Gammaproteobacteria bacterium]